VQVGDAPHRSIWLDSDDRVCIIDQTRLPHVFETCVLATCEAAVVAIRSMQVRGAPLIGVTAAYGVALAMRADSSDAALVAACKMLLATRPTAVNLRFALDEMRSRLLPLSEALRERAAFERAGELADDDRILCRAIGEHGALLIEKLAQSPTRRSKGEPVQILTHCNAGWLATVDYGTALAPVYVAHDRGIPLHVWVDETRPRNQGAGLTAWELGQRGVPHTVVADNAGGHLMQRGEVDLCITGSDRVSAGGDVCNKIGTYLKALAAVDNDVPFYVAFPYSTIDWDLTSGAAIPIEERDPEEVASIEGRNAAGEVVRVRLLPDGSQARNPAFDVTPHHLITGFITERGLCEASAEGLLGLYTERRSGSA